MSHDGVRYVGFRTPHGRGVVSKRVDDLADEPLEVRLGLGVPEADGFEWGTFGPGAAQLALALCAAVLGDDHALAVYHKFKTAVVAHIPTDGFSITAAAVDEWARVLEETQRVPTIPPTQLRFGKGPTHGEADG